MPESLKPADIQGGNGAVNSQADISNTHSQVRMAESCPRMERIIKIIGTKIILLYSARVMGTTVSMNTTKPRVLTVQKSRGTFLFFRSFEWQLPF